MPLTVARTCILLLLCGLLAPLAAQEPIPTLAEADQPPSEVMILGVFHFHNPNADYAQFEGIDVLAPQRQREIEVVVEALEHFWPTRIAIERSTSEDVSQNRDYRRYREGEFDLTANEIHQLGFRLAARLDHEKVYPIDYPMGMRMDSLLSYARMHQPDFLERFDAYIGRIVAMMNRMQAEESIAANLRFLNRPKNVLRTHEPYAVQATIGAGDGYVGARAVADWYERNLRIFANLAAITESGDRVLFIVGAGHTPILRHLVRTHPSMRLVEAIEYLP